MQRRRLLALGALSSAVLLVGGGALALIEPGLRDARLTAAGREVFLACGRAMLQGSLPSGEAAEHDALGSLLDRIDALAAGLPPHAQSELSQLLALLRSGPGRGFAGLAEAWPDAPVPAVQAALQGMRVSSIDLKRQAYQALHDIVAGAYFSEARTWQLLGYPGPRTI
jgi:hypothetical protein